MTDKRGVNYLERVLVVEYDEFKLRVLALNVEAVSLFFDVLLDEVDVNKFCFVCDELVDSVKHIEDFLVGIRDGWLFFVGDYFLILHDEEVVVADSLLDELFRDIRVGVMENGVLEEILDRPVAAVREFEEEGVHDVLVDDERLSAPLVEFLDVHEDVVSGFF